MSPLWARVQGVTGEQDLKEGPPGPRVPGWTSLALPSSQPRPAHEHLSLLQSEPTLHIRARTEITVSPLRPLPRLTPSARPGPHRGHHHWPSPRQVILPTQVPTAVLTMVLCHRPSVWNTHPRVHLENSWPFPGRCL